MRMVRLTSMVALVAVTLTLALTSLTPRAWAGSSSGNSVSGVVTLADGTPVAGAFVAVRGIAGASAFTDASGGYTISGISAGFVMLDASANIGGVIHSGSAFVGFAPGGGSSATANIVVRPAFFPPGPLF